MADIDKTISAFEIMADQWTLLIVRELMYGASTWTHFSSVIAIPPSTLSNRLTKLIAAGCIKKETAPGRRGGVYELTKAGRELFPFMIATREWQVRWDSRPGAFVSPWVHDCGAVVRCVSTCLACHTVVQPEDIVSNKKIHFHGHGVAHNHRARNSINLDRRSVDAKTAKVTVVLGDQKALKLIGSLLQGNERFDDIRKWSGLHPAILSDRLRKLQLLGLCSIRLYQESPDRYIYIPSSSARDLATVIVQLVEWDEKMSTNHVNQGALTHEPCGETLRTELTCCACNGPITYDNTSIHL